MSEELLTGNKPSGRPIGAPTVKSIKVQLLENPEPRIKIQGSPNSKLHRIGLSLDNQDEAEWDVVTPTSSDTDTFEIDFRQNPNEASPFALSYYSAEVTSSITPGRPRSDIDPPESFPYTVRWRRGGDVIAELDPEVDIEV